MSTDGPGPSGARDRRLAELRAEADYHRRRRDLYRARSYSLRATSPTRLRELERAAEQSEARLRHAETGPGSHD